MKTHFNKEEVNQRLIFYPDWKYDDEFLVRHYRFENFMQAFAFLTQVALISEKFNHHPCINFNYKDITLSIKTFDSGGITNKDFQWIEKINQIPYKKVDEF
jgi:4a-hydroxytetrahydrobiopterin dehydratase